MPGRRRSQGRGRRVRDGRKAAVRAAHHQGLASPRRRRRRFPLPRRRADPPFGAGDGEGVDAGHAVVEAAGWFDAPQAAIFPLR